MLLWGAGCPRWDPHLEAQGQPPTTGGAAEGVKPWCGEWRAARRGSPRLRDRAALPRAPSPAAARYPPSPAHAQRPVPSRSPHPHIAAHYVAARPGARAPRRLRPAAQWLTISQLPSRPTGVPWSGGSGHAAGSGAAGSGVGVKRSFTCGILDVSEGDRPPRSGQRALTDCGHLTRIPGRATATNQKVLKGR